MHAKTMEGLLGARTNMNLLNTPFRVYKEARRKGDTAAMERAMGYVSEYSGKAEEYQAEAGKGMEEDAKEAEEKAKLQREEAIRKRREEREILEEKIEEQRNTDAREKTAGLLEISEEGKVLMKDNMDSDNASPDKIKPDAVNKPVIYTKTGETFPAKQGADVSVSV